MRALWSLIVIVVLAVSAAGCASRASSEYAPGSQPGKSSTAAAERAAVLDTVDAAVTDDVGQPVSLVPQSVSIRLPFAAVAAAPLADDGSQIDFSASPKYSAAVNAGAFDAQVLALLKHTDTGWTVLEYELGATDFPGQEWARAHGAPEDIFGQ